MYSKIEVPTDAKYIVVLAYCEVPEVLAVLHGNEYLRAQEIVEQAVAEWIAEYGNDDDYEDCEPYLVDADSVGVAQFIIERPAFDSSGCIFQINFVR